MSINHFRKHVVKASIIDNDTGIMLRLIYMIAVTGSVG